MATRAAHFLKVQK